MKDLEEKIKKIVDKLLEYSDDNTSGMLISTFNLYKIVEKFFYINPDKSQYDSFFEKSLTEYESIRRGHLIKVSDFMCAINYVNLNHEIFS